MLLTDLVHVHILNHWFIQLGFPLGLVGSWNLDSIDLLVWFTMALGWLGVRWLLFRRLAFARITRVERTLLNMHHQRCIVVVWIIVHTMQATLIVDWLGLEYLFAALIAWITLGYNVHTWWTDGPFVPVVSFVFLGNAIHPTLHTFVRLVLATELGY